MTASMIIAAVLIVLGLLFMLASLIGIAKLPDFFTRLHAQGVGDTLGAFLILAGMMVAVHGGLLSVKILLIFIIIVLTNPIGTNLMMIAAINQEDYLGYSSGISSGSGQTGVQPAADDKKDAAAAETVPDKKTDSKKQASEKGKKTDNKKQAPEKGRKTDNKKQAPEKGKKADDGKSAPEKNDRKPASDKVRKKSGKRTSDQTDKTNKKQTKPSQDAVINKAERPEPAAQDKKDRDDNQGRKPQKKKQRRNKPSMNMNKTELIKAAENRGVKVPDGATKREILDLIYADSGRPDNRNPRGSSAKNQKG